MKHRQYVIKQTLEGAVAVSTILGAITAVCYFCSWLFGLLGVA